MDTDILFEEFAQTTLASTLIGGVASMLGMLLSVMTGEPLFAVSIGSASAGIFLMLLFTTLGLAMQASPAEPSFD